MNAKVTCVVDCHNKLGEVPVWDGESQSLYWVDIEGKLLQRYRPADGSVDSWEMPERIACYALREKGGLIVGFASGIALYDLDTRAIQWLAKPEADKDKDPAKVGRTMDAMLQMGKLDIAALERAAAG